MHKTALLTATLAFVAVVFGAAVPTTEETGPGLALGLDDRWMYHDNGNRSYNWNWDNYRQGAGMKFTPTGPVRIDTVLFNNGTSGQNPFRLVIYRDNGPGGSPGTVLLDTAARTSATGWIRVPVQQFDVRITSGSFFVFIYNDTFPFVNTRPRMGIDNAQFSPTTNWIDSSYDAHRFRTPLPAELPGDWLIRAFVSDTGTATTDVDVRWVYPNFSTTLDSLASNVQPACTVQNHSTSAQTFTVRMRIGSFYDNTATVTNLAAGARTRVLFPTYSTWPRDTWPVRCSVNCSGDQRPWNDTMNSKVFCRVLDAQTDSILAPWGVVDSGAAVPCTAVVRNLSSIRTSISTRFTVAGYAQTVTSATLDPGATARVAFTWPPANQPRGTHVTSCSTRLTNDCNQNNNKKTGLVRVRVWDVLPTVILAPTGTVDSGVPIPPQVQVKNEGTDTTTFQVRFEIEGGYSNAQSVTNLPPGEFRTVTFSSWNPPGRGTFATRCSTILTSDRVTINDTLSGSVSVRVVDAAVTEIIGPSGTYDSGATATPRAVVQNLGSESATFDVRFTIGAYSDTQRVTDLGPSAVDTVSFALWTARARGTFATKCSVMLENDRVPNNNQQEGSVTVNVHDYSTRAIVRPVGQILPGPVTPEATVRNMGTVREPGAVHFAIGSVYAQTVNLPDGLPPGTDTSVTFPSWTAVPGNYVATCFTILATDQVRSNDTARSSFGVGAVDVGVTAITAPTGVMDTSADAVPAATVRNFGDQAATFTVFCNISSEGANVYTSSRTVTALASQASADVIFDTLPKPHTPGDYSVRCSTYIAYDGNPANDTMSTSFSFTAGPPPPPWTLKNPMPTGAKPVGDGGWLGWDFGTTRLFAARGNKQSDFYSYDVIGDSWTKKADWPDGTEAKKPSKGAVGTAASNQDGTFFALKGNNTTAFWSYSVALDSWKQLRDIPLGTSKKKVKGGSDLVFVPGVTPEEDFVYCLKGGKNEFYRYGVAADSWEELNPVPAPVQKYDKGSWLCLADSLIFCHQAKYQTLLAYNLNTRSWGMPLKPMPTLNSVGKKKKSKDGGAGALHAGFIYALKGGNTQEFWKYDVGADSWTEVETIPVGTAKKKVKGGGDIVALTGYSTPALYAFKGNKTNELWLYTPAARVVQAQAPRVTQTQVQAQNRFELGNRRLAVLPNPLTQGHAVLHYSLPRASQATVSIYDATGRAVFVRNLGLTRTGSTALDLRGLGAGVYLARLESGSFAVTHKLVVEQ